jgi:hypothetical protein
MDERRFARGGRGKREETRDKKINWHEGYIAVIVGSPTWLRHY